MMFLMGLSIQSLLDLAVAGISLMIVLGIFTFITSILCSAAFLQTAKDFSATTTDDFHIFRNLRNSISRIMSQIACLQKFKNYTRLSSSGGRQETINERYSNPEKITEFL
ncbi:unnamed protein product [Prunus armeniaca]|uniref:Uncharacterized protein n=1 Tax=Prunus armeniaca TaxID=36596 RepID=A0A6J5TMJ1_PRUAR|nr:unnamed protein product [Prunus armeniaca]CAB4295479.1 unnamed protein product [Prunus armeniaca]